LGVVLKYQEDVAAMRAGGARAILEGIPSAEPVGKS
jgi:hypothetical protein